MSGGLKPGGGAGGVPTSRTVAGVALSGDVSTAQIAAAVGLGAVTATGGTAAAARGAIAPVVDLTAAGWSAVAGSGITPGLAAGVATFSFGSGVAAPGGSEPKVRGDLATLQGGSLLDWDLRFRVTAQTPGAGSLLVGVYVYDPTGATLHGYLAVTNGTSGGVGAITGQVDTAFATASSAFSSAGLVSPTAGTAWLRVVREGSELLYCYGTGVGTAEPTTWTFWRSTRVTPTSGAGHALGARFDFFAQQSAPGPTSTVVHTIHEVKLYPKGLR